MKTSNRLTRIVITATLIFGCQQVWSLDEGTTIIGTKEAPNVLNVVPWQNRELKVDPWDSKPSLDSQLLNDSLKPVDQDELRRQVEYFNLLQHSDPQAIDQ